MEERPESYDHIWEGAYGVMQGSILGRWVAQAEREGRITDSIHYDAESGPLEISCDLGFRDTASFWYWQRLSGGYNLLMYDGDNGLDANDWIPRIQKNIVKLGAESAKIWLPHDARAKTFQSKETVIEKFISAFGSGSCSVVPQSKKQDQISAARSIIQKCAFNRTECEMGLDGLMAWEFEYNEENGVFSREPIHNWASHPSDAFAYGCQVMQEHSPPGTERIKMPMRGEINVTTATLDELWATAPKRSGRI
jgi:phage terminase large subunit